MAPSLVLAYLAYRVISSETSVCELTSDPSSSASNQPTNSKSSLKLSFISGLTRLSPSVSPIFFVKVASVSSISPYFPTLRVIVFGSDVAFKSVIENSEEP